MRARGCFFETSPTVLGFLIRATCLPKSRRIRHEGRVIPCNAPGDNAKWLVLFVSAVALLSLVFVPNLSQELDSNTSDEFSPGNDLRDWK
jgi:hypothetical protein